MELKFRKGQNFDCIEGCARCCQAGWRVTLEPAAVQLVREHYVGLPVLQDKDGRTLLEREGDDCVMLDSQRLCRLHRDFGVEAKPLTCRAFPFILEPTPNGVAVGVSFYCPAVQQNRGRPVSEHLGELARLVEKTQPQPIESTPAIFGILKIRWDAYEQLEDRLDREIGRDPGALGRILWRLGGWILAQKSRPAVLETGDLPELLCGRRPEAREAQWLAWLEELFAAALVGAVEANVPEQVWSIQDDLARGGEVVLGRLGWRGTGDELKACLPDLVLPSSEVTRYLRELLFRKHLVSEGPLLANLMLLFLLPRFLAVYTALGALARGAPGAQAEDYWRAVDAAEYHLFAHGRKASELSRHFSNLFLDQLSSRVSGWRVVSPGPAAPSSVADAK
ncbi:MAG: YkgJ family cysteine cluster protein [Armatimonadetes bacterium]|nr:YkgJ family cysteine cluster protein [Armatimonadota bacterium]